MRADELPPLTGFLLGGRVDAGIDVSPYRLADAGATVGFALRLSGPLAHAADMGGLRPFLMTGPALFLLEPRDAGTLPVPQGEPGAVLGLRAGAAVAWQLDRSSSLFGEYRVTYGGADALARSGAGARGRSAATTSSTESASGSDGMRRALTTVRGWCRCLDILTAGGSPQ